MPSHRKSIWLKVKRLLYCSLNIKSFSSLLLRTSTVCFPLFYLCSFISVSVPGFFCFLFFVVDSNLYHCLCFVKSVPDIPAVVSNKEVREGDRVEIQCEPSEVGTMVIWFRVLDNSGMEYIGSFSKDGVRKATPTALSTSFGVTNMNKNVLTLNSFKAKEDAGVYGCAGLKSNELKFGRVTRLSGGGIIVLVIRLNSTKGFNVTHVSLVPVLVKKKVEEVTSVMVARTAPPNLPATTTACVCESPRGNRQNCSLRSNFPRLV